MFTKYLIRTLLLTCVLLVPMPAAAAEDGDARDLLWDDLMPEGWRPFDPYRDLTEEQLDQLWEGSPLEQELLQQYIEEKNSAPVVDALNGQRVRIPGYIVPLDFSGKDLTEFLLVPYFGACIHVPPPPANQIIYVKADEPFRDGAMFVPVWVTGTISTKTHVNDLGDAGYTIAATHIEKYRLPGN